MNYYQAWNKTQMQENNRPFCEIKSIFNQTQGDYITVRRKLKELKLNSVFNIHLLFRL